MEGKKKFSKKRIVFAVIAGVVVVAGALGLGLKAYQTETANAKRAAAKFVRQVSNDSTKEIEITRDISLSEPLVIDTEKVIIGSGLIKASSEWETVNGDMDYLFVIKEGGSLTVKGSVKMDAQNHVGAIYVDKETNLSLEEQAEIIGGKENAIYNAGAFAQKGGIVKGSFNNVYVAEGGKFAFSEGENKTAGNCGILVAEGAYLNTTTLKASVQKARTDGIRVEGEAVIDHIRMLENRRNQIHVTETGKLTLNKGNFEKAKLHGITNSGTMVMNNGVITESGSSGIVNMGTLDMKGGRIYANEEKGVINRRGGTLTILSENATITGNNIGVAVEENSKAEIAKANLNSNDLYNISCFGELYLHDIETGDSGSNCIATNYGGHIVAENMVITSTRTNNGFYNINGSLIELKNVTIKDTKAKGIQNKGATLIGENVTITGCGQGVGTGDFAFGIKNKVELNNLVIKETKGINVLMDKETKGTLKITNAELGFSESNNIRTYSGKLILENVKINGTKGTGTPGTKEYKANTHCILSDETEIVAKNVRMTNNGGSALRLRAGTKFTGTNITANNIKGNGLSAVETDVNIQKFTVTKTGESAIYLEKSGNITLTNVKITEAAKNNVNIAKKFTGTATLKNAELGKTTTNNIRTYGGKLVLEDVKIYGTSGTVDKNTGKVTLNNHCILADNTTVVAKELWMTSEGGSGLRLRQATKFTGTDVVAENVAYNGISGQDAFVDIKGFTVTKTGQSAIALEKGGKVTLTDVKVTEAGINNVNLAKGFTGTATLKNAELGKTTTNNIRTFGGKLVLEDVKIYGASPTENKDTGKVSFNNHGILADNTEVQVKNLYVTNGGGSGLRLRTGTKLTGTDVVTEDVAYNGLSSQDASAKIKGFTVTKTGESAIALEKSGNVTLTNVKVTEAGINNINIAEGFTGTATLKNAELGKTTTNNIRTYDGKLVLEDVEVYGVSGASDHCICTDNTTVEAKNIWMTNEEGASGLRLREGTIFTGTDITIENVKSNGISSTDASADIKGLTVTKTGESAIYFEKSGNITLTDVKVTEAGKNNVNIAEGFTGTATLKNAELGKTTTNNIRTYGGKLVLEDVKVYGASGTSNHCILTDNTTVEADNVWMTNEEGASGLRLRKDTTFNGTDITIENVKGNGISTATNTVDTTITGLTIQGAQGDAIVYDTKGTHILEDVTIATADDKCGVSVNSENAVVSMTDATITGGSKAINNNGTLTLVSGWYQNDIEQNGTLTMGTDAVVGYNANWEGTPGKVILANGTPVQFSGETKHTDDLPMTFSVATPIDKAIVATFTSPETAIALQNRFIMDDDNILLEADDKNLILDMSGNIAKVDGKYYKDLQSAINAAISTQAGVVELVSEYPIVVSSTIGIPENAQVTVKDNGTEQKLVRAAGTDGNTRFVLFDVSEGATFSIESTGNITIDGNNGATTPTDANWAMFAVFKDATLNMSGNIKVMNNTSTKAGSVIRTEAGAKEININGAVFEKNVSGDLGIIYMADQATKIVVQNTEFIENSAKYGGAIYSKSTDVTINGCKFIKNSASSNGGAINFEGTVVSTITNTVFEGNQANKAGAITVGTGGKVSFADCEFKDNKNTGTGNNYEGDDIRLGGATCEVKISGKFVGNVHSRNSSKVQIVGALTEGSAVEVDWYDRRTHSTPVPNYFPLDAILFVDAQGNANANATEVEANKNYIQLDERTYNQGLELQYEGTTGKVVVDKSVATVNGTPHESLVAAVNAANAIVSDGTTIVTLLKDTEVESAMTINRNITIQNKAGRSITVYRGAGLAAANMFDVKAAGSLTIQGVETADSLIFDGRTKAEAEANKGIDAAVGSSASMINNNGTVNLNDVTVQYVKRVDGNGSVIYNQGTSFNASGCTFSYNRGREGGVIWSNKHYTVDGCTFTENSSTTYGGVILNRSTANITNSTFQSNQAGSEGGVISTIATTGLIIENCHFIENSATNGGAIRTNATDVTLTITGCGFDGNNVTGSGGAIYTQSSKTTTIEECEFIENSAKYGGAICTPNDKAINVIVDGSEFKKNSATTSGGAINFGTQTTGTIKNNTSFEGNEAPQAGAITVAGGGKVSFADCEFKDNKHTGNASSYQGNDIRLGGAACEIKISGKFVGNVYNRNKSKVQIVGALSAGSAVELDWYTPNFTLPFNMSVTFANPEVESASISFIKLGTLTTGYGCELVDSATANALDLVEKN